MERYLEWNIAESAKVGDFLRIQAGFTKKQISHTLDQNRQSRCSTRIQAACPYKSLNIQCHDQRCHADHQNSLSIFFYIKSHLSPPFPYYISLYAKRECLRIPFLQ